MDLPRRPPGAIDKFRHVQYFRRIIQVMPSQMACFDSNRMMFGFFAISGLDLLNALDALKERERIEAIEWIYRMQVVGAGARSGFQASTTLPVESPDYACGHLSITYTALAMLLALGDDLSRIDRKAIVEGMRSCQNPDGCFIAMIPGSESDMRFLYCACCVCAILDDWSGMDKERAIDYIVKSISYDGAMGQGPGLESHGGSTFCAVASLYLMNELYNVLSREELEKLRRWCLMRQIQGFQGRPGKPEDTCYSFWIGATLHMLEIQHFSDAEENREFILRTQDTTIGGFAKSCDTRADPLHAYLSVSALSLLGEPGLQPLNAALNISSRAYAHLKDLHNKWNK